MIRINPFFLLTILLACICGQLLPVLCVFCVAVLHEAGHGLTALILGYEIQQVNILPFGVNLKLAQENFRSFHDEILIAAAGPMVNLILIITGLIFAFFWKVDIQVYIYCNIYMLLINLLPILPLDGGRILSVALKQELGTRKGEAIIHTISILSTLIILFAGGVLLYRTKFNYSLFIAAAFLLSCISQNSVRQNRMLSVLRYHSDEVEMVKHYAVNGGVKAGKILKSAQGNRLAVYDILDDSACYLGSITNKQLIDGVVEHGYEIPLIKLL